MLAGWLAGWLRENASKRLFYIYIFFRVSKGELYSCCVLVWDVNTIIKAHGVTTIEKILAWVFEWTAGVEEDGFWVYTFLTRQSFLRTCIFFLVIVVLRVVIYICENECVILGIETWFITCENRKGCSYIHNHGRIYYKSMTNFVQIWIANRNLWFFFFFDFCYFWLLNYF